MAPGARTPGPRPARCSDGRSARPPGPRAGPCCRRARRGWSWSTADGPRSASRVRWANPSASSRSVSRSSRSSCRAVGVAGHACDPTRRAAATQADGWRYWRTVCSIIRWHACRTPDAHRGRPGPHRPDPRDLRRPAGPEGLGRRGGRGVPPRHLRAAGQVRAAVPAVRRGARGWRPAVRGLPAGGGGDRLGLDERRRRGLRALPVLLPRGRSSAPQEQRAALLPDMLGGDQLGAYCLSEPQAGSDVVRDLDPRHARGGRLVVPREGHQGVDLPRRARRLLHRLRPHGRRTRARACPAS